jgi:hypothetical protein
VPVDDDKCEKAEILALLNLAWLRVVCVCVGSDGDIGPSASHKRRVFDQVSARTTACDHGASDCHAKRRSIVDGLVSERISGLGNGGGRRCSRCNEFSTKFHEIHTMLTLFATTSLVCTSLVTRPQDRDYDALSRDDVQALCAAIEAGMDPGSLATSVSLLGNAISGGHVKCM